MADSELALVNKVELRIALAGTDDKLETALALYLSPLLLKLSSPHSQVRSAVFKIIQHLIQRINSAKTVKLPIEPLLNQVKNPNVPSNLDSTSVRLYSLLFISRGIDRLSDQDKHQLVPKIIDGIATYTTSISARLFNLLCKLLNAWSPPTKGSREADEINQFLGFDKSPDDEKFLCQCFTKLFLLNPNPNPSANSDVNTRGYACPGLSSEDCAFLTVDAGVQFKGPDLLNIKKSVIKFISFGFQESNLVLPLLIAKCDSSSYINDNAETLFKKLEFSYEDTELVDALILLLLGDQQKGRPPAKNTVQENIVSILNRSKVAAKSPKSSQICSIGLNSEYGRLKQATIQFIKWVSNNDNDSSTVSSSSFNTSIVAQLKSNLLSEGWPQMNTASISNYSNSIKQRRSQYEALGTVLKSNPELINNDLSYIEFLFSSLEGEMPDLRSTVQDSLSGLTVHLPNMTEPLKETLKYLLKGYLSSDFDSAENIDNIHACRYTAIKFVNCTFAFNDADARFLCILGTSFKNRSDTVEESEKGLHPHWFNILQASNTTQFKPTSELLGANNTIEFPTFQSLISVLDSEIQIAKQSPQAMLRACMKRAIQFALETLVMQSIKGRSTVIVPDEEWSIRLNKALEFDDTVKSLVRSEIHRVSSEDVDMDDNESTNVLVLYLQIILNESVQKQLDGYVVSLYSGPKPSFGGTFNRILALSPSDVVEKFIKDIPRLLVCIQNSKYHQSETTIQLSKSLGVIASHPLVTNSEVLEIFDTLMRPSITVGQISSASYLLSRLFLRGRTEIVDSNRYDMILKFLLSALKDQKLYDTALESIGQMAMFGVLGPIVAIGNQSYFIEQYLSEVKAKVKKFDEKSILTWGYLSLCRPEDASEEPTEFESIVYDSHSSKQIEFLFSSGEALSVIASSWDSQVLNRNLDIEYDDFSLIPQRSSRLGKVLNHVLKSCSSTKPTLRKAGCIWLLSLVQYCGHLNAIKVRASEIHITFMRFLADRDELIQESASRGLSIVYEMGDTELKDTLVHSLLRSFTDSTSASKLSSGTVSHETQLFEPGVLKTEDGSVSTYKDILSLASEVGDPSLVYKFMSLAKSSALWTSRKGIAFGLGSILSKSSLDKLLIKNESLANKLIPKLYRYRFDPTPSVSTSMNDIWNSLISDSSKTISDNFNSILDELLVSMGNREWRVRQASSTALLDLIQCVHSDVYETRMEDIWNMSFRTMDDIKESVRNEGSKLTRSLASTLVKSIDPNSGGSRHRAHEVLSKLIPFLLGNKGMLSDAEDIKNFAIQTILTLCQKSGSSIKPFIPGLLFEFIVLMSTLEPSVVNYLALNASKYNLEVNDIDARRLQSVGSSPMMEAIEKMVDMIDAELMKEVVPSLQKAVRKSIGLPSKVAGSKVIVSLVVRHLNSIEPYGPTLLKTCLQHINDRNDTIASSYATAAGYICRVSPIGDVLAFSDQITSIYFTSENERGRKIAAIASEGVSKYSGDKFNSVASAFLPLAFIAKNDLDRAVSAPFEREWTENTSGNGAVKLYIKEISELVKKNLDSAQYSIRQIVAKSIANACASIDDAYNIGMSGSSLFDVLLESCKGRSWTGKELVLEALVELSIKSKTFILSKDDEELADRINKTILTEAKRRNKDYQKHSIKAFGKYLGSFPNDELIDEYLELISMVLDDEYYEESDESDEDQRERSKTNSLKKKSSKRNIEREEERLSFLKSLIASFAIHDNIIDERLLIFILVKIRNVFESQKIIVTWRSQISTCESFSVLLNLVNGISSAKLTSLVLKEFEQTWLVLFEKCGKVNEMENVKIQFIRISGLLLISMSHYQNSAEKTSFIDRIKVGLEDMLKIENSSIVKTEINKIDYH